MTEATEAGQRSYVKDTPNDPLMKLVIELFPSPAGQLASQTQGNDNFGKDATVQKVAAMLVFAHKYRTLKTVKKNLIL